MDALFFELALSVKAAQRALERVTNEAVRPLGVTAAQADAIAVIGQAGPVSLKELGELLIAEAGHPSRLVDRLVDAGLVARRAAGDDRRRIELTLTADGRELQGRIEAAREGVLAVARELVGERDIMPALELLRHMLQVTPYPALIERRRALLEQANAQSRPASRAR